MLDLQNLRYQAATAAEPVLRGVSLRLLPGELHLLAGPSGCGKTTLLEVIGGLAEPQAGQVVWNGEALDARQRRWLCGLVFQFPERHFLGLSVAQELRLGHRRLEGERSAAVLRQVGLADVPQQLPPERLSGGQQRRLALAVQLLRNPKVLLLDEPTAGLDWQVREEVLQLLRTLAGQRTMLVVTHEPDLFAGMGAQRWWLERGYLRQVEPSGTVPV